MKNIIYIFNLLKISTMNWLMLYWKYFLKMNSSLKLMLSNPATAISGGTVIVAASTTSVQKSLILLFIFFILDFITGIIASWREKKKAEINNPELKKKTLISSEKLKLSAIKAFTYTSSILGVWAIEKIFFIKTFKFDSITDQDLTITIIFVGFCCAIEFYSIVFENFKRMGYDIAKKFLTMIKGLKKLFLEIKE
jgi:phage-related holin